MFETITHLFIYVIVIYILKYTPRPVLKPYALWGQERVNLPRAKICLLLSITKRDLIKARAMRN